MPKFEQSVEKGKSGESKESKEFTREELFKRALHYLEFEVNRGNSSDTKIRTKELRNQEGSFMEEITKKAWEMVDNGEAERIAKQTYTGGVEKRKDPEDYEDDKED